MSIIKEGYKETEIGVIPEEWEVAKLSDVCKFKQGIQIPIEEQDTKPSNDKIRFLRISDYTQKTDDIRYVNKEYSDYIISNDDIVMVRYGETAGFIGTNLSGVLANNLFSINPNKQITKRYLYTYMNDENIYNYLKSLRAAGAMPAVSFKSLNIIKIPLPPLKEQEKIADILSTADEKIDAITSQIQKAETFKIGLLQKLLSEGIPNYGAGTSVPKREGKESWTKVQAPRRKFKDSEIGKIPEEWEVVELATITTILLSNVDKKSKEDEQDVKLCNYMDVYNNQYITNDLDYMKATAKDNQIEKFQLKINDVIITKDSETKDDIAIPAVIMETFENLLCGYHLAVLRPKEKILYGVYLMKAIQYIPVHKHFEKLANGITRFGLTSTSINQALIPLPPLKEQKQIATILSTADEKLEVLRAKKEKYEELKKGLLQKLLSGEVRV